MTHSTRIWYAAIAILASTGLAQNATARQSSTITSESNSAQTVQTYTSFTDGPYVTVVAYDWYPIFDPHNATVPSRNDTDARGTVTSATTGAYGQLVTLTYPSVYVAPTGSYLSWRAVMPLTFKSVTCCSEIVVSSLRPTQLSYPTDYYFASSQDANPTDLQGLRYTLAKQQFIGHLGARHIWSTEIPKLPYSGCSYADCGGDQHAIPVQPVTAVDTIYFSSEPAVTGIPFPSQTRVPPLNTLPAIPHHPIPGGGIDPVDAQPTIFPQSAIPLQPIPTLVPARTETPIDSEPTVQPISPIVVAPPLDPELSSATSLVPGNIQTSQDRFVHSSASAGGRHHDDGHLQTAGPTPPDDHLSSSGSAPPFTLGSTVIMADTSSHYVIGGQTLLPGSAVTVSGTTVSLAAGSTALVVNGQTQVPEPTPSPVLTIGSARVTAISSGDYVVGGKTLHPGSAVTVSGTTISLATGGSAIIVNGRTTTIRSTTGADGFVWSALAHSTVQSYTIAPQHSGTFAAAPIPLASTSPTTSDGRKVELELCWQALVVTSGLVAIALW